MHENREISCTSWSTDQDRSAKAIKTSRTTKGSSLRRRLGREGHGLRRTSFHPTCVRHRAGSACPRDCTVCGQQHVSPPFIHGKSRMRKRARTDLRGGRSAMVVPTATVIQLLPHRPSYARSFRQRFLLIRRTLTGGVKAPGSQRRQACVWI